jgi:hypothetical protein
MKSLNRKIIIIDNSKLSYDGNDLDGIKVRGNRNVTNFVSRTIC